MTLTEFLTARLDEDAAETWTIVPYSCEPGCCAPAGWVGHQCRWCDACVIYGGTVEAITASARDHAEEIHQRSRVLAEVDAKRRIVAMWTAVARTERRPTAVRGRYDVVDVREPRWEIAGDVLLPLLALPYADHADYDESWRP